MKLEDRLRAELERSGRSTRVGTAPSVDELSTVARGRRTRNRVVGSAGAVALSGVLLFAAFSASQPDDTTVVLADGGSEDTSDVAVAESDVDAVVAESIEEPAVSSSTADESGDSGETAAVVGGDDPILGEVSSDSDDDSPVDATGATGAVDVPDLPDLARVLQGSPGALNVSTRDSAVDFAGASGVLVVPDGSGYRGLATSFVDDGAVQIGLSSVNGLDWVETELTGVPDGATATALRSHGGSYVALFDRFNASLGQKEMFVGVSVDLITWELSEPLAGFDVVATDLAVGPSGVLVIGDDTEPTVWFGPVGGPYERLGQLDATMLHGVTTLDDQFIVAGRSAELGTAIFASTDGKNWTVRPLTSPGDEGASQSVSVADGTIVLTIEGDGAPTTVLSSDGGVTWDLLGEGSVRALSVSGSALGYLGGSSNDATVTLADGNAFATGQLDVAAPDRLSLLSTTSNQAVMLVQGDGGELTWIVASR